MNNTLELHKYFHFWPSGSNENILDSLTEFLALVEEEMGRSVNNYALLWLLAKDIEEAKNNPSFHPLLDEIKRWERDKYTEVKKLKDRGEDLLSVLKSRKSSSSTN